MPRRPKHYDRPNKRPGLPRVRSNDSGGSVIDQKGAADSRDQMIVGWCEWGFREDGSFWTSGV